MPTGWTTAAHARPDRATLRAATRRNRGLLAPLFIAAALAGCSTTPAATAPLRTVTNVAFPLPGSTRAPGTETGWQLVWADEFDGSAIDRAKWDFDIDCWGGGNNERQCYTDDPDNAAIADGVLAITAWREAHTGPALPAHLRGAAATPDALVSKAFTSARLVTRGRAAWRYGRIEVRARLPQGQGTWPAIWMLPEDNAYGPWAASGEIDILEAVNLGVACGNCANGREDAILGTLHFGKRWPGNAFASTETHAPGVLEGFHTFGVIWAPGRIEWTYDGQVYATRRAAEWWTGGSTAPGAPFDRRFHLILNLAIGGGLAEERGVKGVDETGFPKRMLVDWVRVWQCAPATASSGSCKGGD